MNRVLIFFSIVFAIAIVVLGTASIDLALVRASDVTIPMWQVCDRYRDSRAFEACNNLIERYAIDIGRSDLTVPEPHELVTYEDFFYILNQSLDRITEAIYTLESER
ncbi:MAG: hypothetical protein J7641_08015 [Cyanobacteria bacterium SID2]|nr:hypothetical protein [Cyanobacteria bacterium SID2]MBP0005776.1 hypothetical protein [Cyanobacteria bacterium SBC]